MMPATPRPSSIPQAAATSPNARCRVRSGMICRSRASSSASISAAVPTYRSETIFGRPPTRAISRKYQYVLPLIFFGYRLAINLGHTPEQPRGQAPNQHVTSRNASASASHWASDNHDHRKLKLAVGRGQRPLDLLRRGDDRVRVPLAGRRPQALDRSGDRQRGHHHRRVVDRRADRGDARDALTDALRPPAPQRLRVAVQQPYPGVTLDDEQRADRHGFFLYL